MTKIVNGNCWFKKKQKHARPLQMFYLLFLETHFQTLIGLLSLALLNSTDLARFFFKINKMASTKQWTEFNSCFVMLNVILNRKQGRTMIYNFVDVKCYR